MLSREAIAIAAATVLLPVAPLLVTKISRGKVIAKELSRLPQESIHLM